MALLEINGLKVFFDTPAGTAHAVDEVSFSVEKGDIVGIVGESGCGKSVTAMSIPRLVPTPPSRRVAGTINFDGKELTTLPYEELRKLRGAEIGVVFQDPMTALSPLHKIGSQLIEGLLLHHNISKSDALIKAKAMLEKCGLPERCLNAFPFQLSGGQQQRAMIAATLMLEPKLLIADEPTTALDVTIQRQILELMKNAKQEETAMLLITHNIAIVKELCNKLIIMYAGEIVESGSAYEIFFNPRHPYTKALLEAMPSSGARGERLSTIPGAVPSPTVYPTGCRFAARCRFASDACSEAHPTLEAFSSIDSSHLCRCSQTLYTEEKTRLSEAKNYANEDTSSTRGKEPILSIRSISKAFKTVKAVNDATFDVMQGETFAIVGESGCGKTTLSRIIAGLLPYDNGAVYLEGKELTQKRSKQEHRAIQMVFQNPFSSLNPRMNIMDILTEGPLAHKLIKKSEREQYALELLHAVGLPEDALHRYPNEFSGGQLQRISIARAIAMKPSIIICDEPVSALDVSIQAQVINLLMDLQTQRNITYIFITHDISLVKRIADKVAVMQNGYIVEQGTCESIFNHPQHDFSKQLLMS
jgi:oligopeptide/dipeptide ABC transporter ATP-binding protein